MLYDGKLLMLASPPGAKHHVGGPAQDDIGQAGHQHHQGHSTISIISIVSIISIISIIRPSVPSFFLLYVAFMFFIRKDRSPLMILRENGKQILCLKIAHPGVHYGMILHHLICHSIMWYVGTPCCTAQHIINYCGTLCYLMVPFNIL